MGLFQRFKKGAPEPGDEDRRTGRSPDQARALVDTLAEELRALKSEIKLLRESFADSGGRIPDSSPGEPRRKSRGGRGRGRASKEGEQRPTDQRPEQRRSLPKEPPEDAPVGLLVDYLNGRGVTVFEGSDDLNRNEAFEHLARHLGTHFDLLSPFYEKMKRCVATGRGQRIDIDHFSDQERSAAVQFGTLLHRHGMLKDFYYHRSPKKQLRVIPTKDGQVGQFLTGGWLEIYVSLQLLRRMKAKYSPAKFQLLYNVKGTLPDGREFEADLMAAVEGKLFWLECKTGHWQDYAARFRGLVDIFGVDRGSGALLLIRPPDQGTRQRATDMLNMTLLSLSEVDEFINGFLGLEPGEGLDDDFDVAPVGTIPPLSEDEIPLENAEPARKLGRVKLDGSDEEEEDGDGEGSAARRKRRRRRGGRGGRNRNRSSSGEESQGESPDHSDRSSRGGGRSGGPKPPSTTRALLEALPIERDSDGGAEADAGKADAEANGEAAKAESGAGALPPGMIAAAGDGQSSDEGDETPARKRSRGRRGGRGRRRGGSAEGEAVDAPSEASEADSAAEVAEASEESESKAESKAESQDEDGKSEAPKRRRRRSTRKSPFAVDEDAAEAAEAADSTDAEPAQGAAPEEAPAEEAEAEKPKAKPKPRAKAKPKAEAESKPEPKPEPQAEPEPEAEEEVEAPAAAAAEAPKTSAKGTVIAPDLAAMMAGSKDKAKDD